MSKQAERLKNLVGFDPAKRPQLTDDIFKEVMKDINEERAEKAKERAKGLLEQAFALREQMAKARSDFEGQEKKFDKQLGKLLNRLEAELRGAASSEESESEEAEAEADGGEG